MESVLLTAFNSVDLLLSPSTVMKTSWSRVPYFYFKKKFKYFENKYHFQELTGKMFLKITLKMNRMRMAVCETKPFKTGITLEGWKYQSGCSHGTVLPQLKETWFKMLLNGCHPGNDRWLPHHTYILFWGYLRYSVHLHSRETHIQLWRDWGQSPHDIACAWLSVCMFMCTSHIWSRSGMVGTIRDICDIISYL